MLNDLRSIERRVWTQVVDIYDKAKQASLLPLLAQVANAPADQIAQNIITMEWLWIFPQLRRWVGDRQIQKAFKGALSFTPENYEITYEMNQLKMLDPGKVLAEVSDASPKIITEFMEGQPMLALQVIRDNGTTYDGQSLLDTDHVHPDGVTQFSNILANVRANDAAPTAAELIAEMKAAKRRLLRNSLFRNKLIETTQVNKDLVAITRSDAIETVLNDILTEEEIGGNKNSLRGSFRILRDLDPVSGSENAWDLIWAAPGGPRPTIFVDVRKVNGIEFDEGKKFATGSVPFGAWSRYAVAPGFPQTIVRNQPD